MRLPASNPRRELSITRVERKNSDLRPRRSKRDPLSGLFVEFRHFTGDALAAAHLENGIH